LREESHISTVYAVRAGTRIGVIVGKGKGVDMGTGCLYSYRT
jgi:hypothetical protein